MVEVGGERARFNLSDVMRDHTMVAVIWAKIARAACKRVVDVRGPNLWNQRAV